MFLATTSLKEFWDERDEVLILGPWCVRFEDPAWLSGIRHRMLPNVWDDRARLERCAHCAQEVQEELLDGLTAYLNGVHGTGLSRRYWRILLGGWLLYYTHQLLDRFTQVQEAFAAFPDAASLALDEADYRVPRDTAEFLPLYHTDHYNLQLYSQIFRFLGKEFPRRRHAPPVLAPPAARGLLRGWAEGAAASGSQWALASLGADVVTDDLYPTGQRLLWRLMARLRGRALPLLRKLPEDLRAEAVLDGRRRGLATLPAKGELSKLLVSTLPHALPAVALEGFARAREASPARRGRTPSAVFSSVGVFYNDFFKLAAAEWVERGAQLWGLQHGGQYGTAKYSLAEWHERAICDRYHTWGWAASEGDPKLRDLPVPKLCEAARRPRRADPGARDILLLTLENVRNAHHLFPHPLGWQWEDHFGDLQRFIAGLEGEAAAVALRPYPHDYGWNHRARLAARFPGLRFDAGSQPLLERARTARLVATDYPGTPFFELLACGVPSVHFWNDAHWEMRAGAAPYFDALREAGVVHSNPQSAARHARAVYADPAAWWDSPRVAKARAALVNRYCATEPDWLRPWTAAFSL